MEGRVRGRKFVVRGPEEKTSRSERLELGKHPPKNPRTQCCLRSEKSLVSDVFLAREELRLSSCVQLLIHHHHRQRQPTVSIQAVADTKYLSGPEVCILGESLLLSHSGSDHTVLQLSTRC